MIFIYMLGLMGDKNLVSRLGHPSVHSLVCPLVAWQEIRPFGAPVAAWPVAGNGAGGAVLGHLKH